MYIYIHIRLACWHPWKPINRSNVGGVTRYFQFVWVAYAYGPWYLWVSLLSFLQMFPTHPVFLVFEPPQVRSTWFWWSPSGQQHRPGAQLCPKHVGLQASASLSPRFRGGCTLGWFASQRRDHFRPCSIKINGDTMMFWIETKIAPCCGSRNDVWYQGLWRWVCVLFQVSSKHFNMRCKAGTEIVGTDQFECRDQNLIRMISSPRFEKWTFFFAEVKHFETADMGGDSCYFIFFREVEVWKDMKGGFDQIECRFPTFLPVQPMQDHRTVIAFGHSHCLSLHLHN